VTAAELKTIRESLGLTTQWIADQAGVRLRTAQYWEQGDRMSVPGDVADMLLKIDQQLDTAVKQSIDVVQEIINKNGKPEEIVLVRYRNDSDLWHFRPDMKPLPASTHAVLLARMSKALAHIDIVFRIEYMEPEEYKNWLGNKKDSEANRSQWAAMKCSDKSES